MTYIPFPGTNIRSAIENAIKMSRATGKDIYIKMNNALFCVNRDTQIQDALDLYLDALNKVKNTEQQLQQLTR